MTAEEIITKLNLSPLPLEGGYYRETYRSNETLDPADSLEDSRAIATAIYYLLTPNSSSAFHKLKSDEIFHFYSGDPVEMLQIDAEGELKRFTIGSAIFSGEQPQCLVKADTWQASFLKNEGRFALMGTTVSPGFDFADFELAKEDDMLREFPKHQLTIRRIFRDGKA